MRKLSPFSQERLRAYLLENHGRKSPTKGETLAISGLSEGERASQDYKPQDKQTSQSGSAVLKPQRKGQRPWGRQAGTDRAGPARAPRCAGLNRHSPEVDAGGQFPLLFRQPGLGKKNLHICEEGRGRSRLWCQNKGQEDPHLQAGARHLLSPPRPLRGEGPARKLRKVLKQPYLPRVERDRTIG